MRRANQLVGRRRENPEKKHLAHTQAELGLSHLYPMLGLKPHVGLEPTEKKQWDDRMVKFGNEISVLLTTGPQGLPKTN